MEDATTARATAPIMDAIGAANAPRATDACAKVAIAVPSAERTDKWTGSWC
jgi:hypothetical protein